MGGRRAVAGPERGWAEEELGGKIKSLSGFFFFWGGVREGENLFFF